MKDKIKELRIRIDGLAQLTKELNPAEKVYWSRQIDNAQDSLLLSKAWLGKVLEELGEETPYKNDGNRKTVEDIEPTADVNQDIHGYNLEVVHFEDKSHIERVDWLRQEIQELIKECDLTIGEIDTSKLGISSSDFIIQCDRFVLQHLAEARFWLGFELERIKNEQNRILTIK